MISKENILIYRKLTLKKVVNFALVYISYYLSAWTKKAIVWGKPINLAIEPTTSCNLRCPECPSGLRSFTRPTGMLDFELFKKIVDEQYKHLYFLTLYFQGEPYLHPQFVELVSYANEKNIFIGTSTNAHYLTSSMAEKTVRSGLDRLIISVDGTTQETYESYRVGGKLAKVIEGIEQITNWKKKLKSDTPFIIIQFLVVKPNEHQIDEILSWKTKYGVDEVKLKTAQIYDYKNGSPFITSIDKHSRYALKGDEYVFKGTMKNQCWKMWQGPVITWDGKIVPCCFDKDAEFSQGDIKDSSIDKIWQNESYSNFRKAVLKSRKNISICSNCTEGTKVWE